MLLSNEFAAWVHTFSINPRIVEAPVAKRSESFREFFMNRSSSTLTSH